MYRLEGLKGEKIRLVQHTDASSITILFQDGTIVVNSEPTIVIPPLPLRFYDFTPDQSGSYLIRWEGADPDKQWEVIDVKQFSLRWIIQQIKAKTDNLPSARTG